RASLPAQGPLDEDGRPAPPDRRRAAPRGRHRDRPRPLPGLPRPADVARADRAAAQKPGQGGRMTEAVAPARRARPKAHALLFRYSAWDAVPAALVFVHIGLLLAFFVVW